MRWTTLVVLLRMVLHVLRKIDAEQDSRIKEASEVRWAKLLEAKAARDPEVVIFTEFIEEDRNLILKEYRYRVGQGVNIYSRGSGSPDVEIIYEMTDGPFLGQDPRQVAAEAIAWLERYLDEVDQAIRDPNL